MIFNPHWSSCPLAIVEAYETQCMFVLCFFGTIGKEVLMSIFSKSTLYLMVTDTYEITK